MSDEGHTAAGRRGAPMGPAPFEHLLCQHDDPNVGRGVDQQRSAETAVLAVGAAVQDRPTAQMSMTTSGSGRGAGQIAGVLGTMIFDPRPQCSCSLVISHIRFLTV